MLTVFFFSANVSDSWWEIDIYFKYIIFYEGMIWEVMLEEWKYFCQAQVQNLMITLC